MCGTSREEKPMVEALWILLCISSTYIPTPFASWFATTASAPGNQDREIKKAGLNVAVRPGKLNPLPPCLPSNLQPSVPVGLGVGSPASLVAATIDKSANGNRHQLSSKGPNIPGRWHRPSASLLICGRAGRESSAYFMSIVRYIRPRETREARRLTAGHDPGPCRAHDPAC